MEDGPALETLWQSLRTGEYFPPSLRGRLTLEQALRLQMGLLERRLAEGESQAGWKAGATSVLAREAAGLEAPLWGHLLGAGDFGDPGALVFDDLREPLIEVELCFTLTAALRGPGVTGEQVAAVVGAVAPAFEILERRGDLFADLPLAVAGNLLQKGFVRAPSLRPPPGGLQLGAVGVEVWRDRHLVAAINGWGEAMDDQYGTVAWLANRLAEFGRGLEPGMHIMTGSYIPPTPVARGQTWRAVFAGIGEVALTFS